MNLIKSQDFFNPLDVDGRCHIIGCGSVGSTVAELLARLGITRISLYDFDDVAPHNLANQMFYNEDIKRNKVDVVSEMICKINPNADNEVHVFPDGWSNTVRLSGYVFLCVDNIDLRREIVTLNKMNGSIKAMFDFRTRLEDAQHYAADFSDPMQVENLLKSMAFTHEEAKAETPQTACNVEMSVAPTIRIICSYGVANFMNFIRKKEDKPLKKIVTIDAFDFHIIAN